MLREWFVKFLSREAYLPLVATTIASFALFFDKCGFVEWAAAVGGFMGLSVGSLTIQKVKALDAGGER